MLKLNRGGVSMSNIEDELNLLVESINPLEDIEKFIQEHRKDIRCGIIVLDLINEKGEAVTMVHPSRNISYADANWLLDIAKDFVLHGDEYDS